MPPASMARCPWPKADRSPVCARGRRDSWRQPIASAPPSASCSDHTGYSTLTCRRPVAITALGIPSPRSRATPGSSGESSRPSRHHRPALRVRRTYIRTGVQPAAAIRRRLSRAMPRVRRGSHGLQPGVGRDDVRRSGHLLLRPGHEQMRGLWAAQSGTEPVHERMPAVRRALRGADRVTPGDGAAQRDPGDEPGLPSQAPRSRSAMAHPIDLPT